jgi:dTDP-4-dehydrorhamnose reductase
LLVGPDGQLGTELQISAPPNSDLITAGRSQLDLANTKQISELVQQIQPQVILFAAAWTAVDLAESHQDEAFAINATAAEVMAESAAKLDARLLYVSTDYVFSGVGKKPWREDDPVAPLNTYGQSKLAGEQAVTSHLGDRGHVIRTSWLYGRKGQNFVRTMLSLMAAGRSLKVVSDQQGSPTWAGGLASALWALAQTESAPQILHYTDGGIASWFDFANAIRDTGLANGLGLEDSDVHPCPSTEYPTPAARPAWSPMHFSSAWQELGIQQMPWQSALESALPLMLQS